MAESQRIAALKRKLDQFDAKLNKQGDAVAQAFAVYESTISDLYDIVDAFVASLPQEVQ